MNSSITSIDKEISCIFQIEKVQLYDKTDTKRVETDMDTVNNIIIKPFIESEGQTKRIK
jgi:hypothetical protein